MLFLRIFLLLDEQDDQKMDNCLTKMIGEGKI